MKCLRIDVANLGRDDGRANAEVFPGSGISQDVSWAGISEALPSWWPGSRGKGNVVLALLIRTRFLSPESFQKGRRERLGTLREITGSGYPRYVHHLGNTFVALYVHPVGSTFRFGASDVGNGDASYVGSGAFPTWEAGFCFLSLSRPKPYSPFGAEWCRVKQNVVPAQILTGWRV